MFFLFVALSAVQYGAAVVYLFEAAPAGRKGLCASLAQQAVGACDFIDMT
jgi:hypothetical protein